METRIHFGTNAIINHHHKIRKVRFDGMAFICHYGDGRHNLQHHICRNFSVFIRVAGAVDAGGAEREICVLAGNYLYVWHNMLPEKALFSSLIGSNVL